MKKAGTVLLIVGIAMILFSLLFPIAVVIESVNELEGAAIGIIGGADGPTAMFLYQTLIQGSYLRFVLDAGVIAVIVSVVMLIREKRNK